MSRHSLRDLSLSNADCRPDRGIGDVPRRPNLPYADAHMKDVVLALLHLAVMGAKLSHRGGVRAVLAENLLLKQQLILSMANSKSLSSPA